MVFTAEDMEAARRFVSDLITIHGHTKVSEPQQYSGNIGDLTRMFPLKKKREGDIKEFAVDLYREVPHEQIALSPET